MMLHADLSYATHAGTSAGTTRRCFHGKVPTSTSKRTGTFSKLEVKRTQSRSLAKCGSRAWPMRHGIASGAYARMTARVEASISFAGI